MNAGAFLSELKERNDFPSLMVRYPNWVGDAVMALPGLETIRRSLPSGRLAVLAKPWVADIIGMSSLADEVIHYRQPGEHSGLTGKISLVRHMRRHGFDGAVLFQNAFEAALIAKTAGVPLRGGYSTDARRLLLTHAVVAPHGRRPQEHQVGYYTGLAHSLGFCAPVDKIPRLPVPPDSARDPGMVGFAPGASFGPAKMWPAERYVDLGRRLAAKGCRILVFGSGGEKEICGRVAGGIGNLAEDLSGRTTLREAAHALATLSLLVSNDSGLMHLAAALGTPLVALFGSTDHVATGPLSETSVVIDGSAPCSPCFLRECPRNMECFDPVTVDKVEETCLEMLEGRAKDGW